VHKHFVLAECLAEIKKANFNIHLSERIFMFQGLAEKENCLLNLADNSH